MGRISDFPEESEAEARRRQRRILLSEAAAGKGRRSLGQILVDADIITPRQLAAALKEQRRNPRRLLGTILVEQEVIADDAIAQAVAWQLNLPLVEVSADDVDRRASSLVTRELCAWHVCVPLRVREKTLVLAMANPLDDTALKKVADVSRLEVTPVVATTSDIMTTIEDVYGL